MAWSPVAGASHSFRSSCTTSMTAAAKSPCLRVQAAVRRHVVPRSKLRDGSPNLRCSEVDRSAFTCRKRTERSSPDLDRHRGHVVVVRRMTAELARLVENRIHYFACRAAAMARDDFADAPRTKLLARFGRGFKDTVSTEDEHVAALHR